MFLLGPLVGTAMLKELSVQHKCVAYVQRVAAMRFGRLERSWEYAMILTKRRRTLLVIMPEWRKVELRTCDLLFCMV